MKKPRYWIATTEGPVEITAISEETPGLPSVICLTETFQALPISSAYNEFVRSPTGIIEKLTGKRAFRTDISSDIGQGNSWHLGMCIAHLSWFDSQDNNALQYVWASGTINPSLDVLPVDHIAEKWEATQELLKEAHELGKKIDVFLHPDNADQMPNVEKDIVTIHRVTKISEVMNILRVSANTPDASSGNIRINQFSNPKTYILLAVIAVLMTLVYAFLPLRLIYSWHELEKQGRFQFLSRQLNDTKYEGTFAKMLAANIFSQHLLGRARQNQSFAQFYISQQADLKNANCPGGKVSVSAKSLLPEWFYNPCDYKIELENVSNRNLNISMSIVSQSPDGQLKQHTNNILYLRENELAENLPFRIRAKSDEYIYFIAMITDRPTNQPYKWFQKLISNPLGSNNLKNTIRSAGVGLIVSPVLKPNGLNTDLETSATSASPQGNSS